MNNELCTILQYELGFWTFRSSHPVPSIAISTTFRPRFQGFTKFRGGGEAACLGVRNDASWRRIHRLCGGPARSKKACQVVTEKISHHLPHFPSKKQRISIKEKWRREIAPTVSPSSQIYTTPYVHWARKFVFPVKTVLLILDVVDTILRISILGCSYRNRRIPVSSLTRMCIGCIIDEGLPNR